VTRVRLVVAAALGGLIIGWVPTGSPSRAAGTCAGERVTIIGTEGPDRLVGTNGPDVIDGAGGDDVIDGRGGDDRLCGGRGDDSIDGGGGTDVCDGGPGTNRLRECERPAPH
jgi:Ca2+-binding RTX toxin-like protein